MKPDHPGCPAGLLTSSARLLVIDSLVLKFGRTLELQRHLLRTSALCEAVATVVTHVAQTKKMTIITSFLFLFLFLFLYSLSYYCSSFFSSPCFFLPCFFLVRLLVCLPVFCLVFPPFALVFLVSFSSCSCFVSPLVSSFHSLSPFFYPFLTLSSLSSFSSFLPSSFRPASLPLLPSFLRSFLLAFCLPQSTRAVSEHGFPPC